MILDLNDRMRNFIKEGKVLLKPCACGALSPEVVADRRYSKLGFILLLNGISWFSGRLDLVCPKCKAVRGSTKDMGIMQEAGY